MSKYLCALILLPRMNASFILVCHHLVKISPHSNFTDCTTNALGDFMPRFTRLILTLLT